MSLWCAEIVANVCLDAAQVAAGKFVAWIKDSFLHLPHIYGRGDVSKFIGER